MTEELCEDCFQVIDECTCDRCEECNAKLDHGHDLECPHHEYNQEDE